jgi:hypothetical protein
VRKGGRIAKTIRLVGPALSLAFSVLVVAANPLTAHGAAHIPEVVGPIPVTVDSYPFAAANRSNVPQDLSQSGYVEEEYLVSGFADVYERGPGGKAVVRTPHAPYTTRMLVRRPVSPKAFSGTVVVEILNPTGMYDFDPQWEFSGDYFMEHKDIWVGFTAKPVAALALRVFDPKRYAAISWANPVPFEKTCPDPVSALRDTTRYTENGLVWDIASQVGALVKASDARNPLKGFGVKRAYLTGYSQTGGFLVTYINSIRPLSSAALADGTPVYDGYLIGDGDGLPPALNQCAAPPKAGDPFFVIQPRPEPVISVRSQSLLGWNIPARRADGDSPHDRYRSYEIPGAGHINQRIERLRVNGADCAKAGIAFPTPKCTETTRYGLTDFPFEYFMNAAFANLDAWVRSGTLPPKTPPIDAQLLGGDSLVKKDEYDNALGGLRSPYLDVPVARYYAKSTPGDVATGSVCGLLGYKVPFDKDVIAKLYPSHELYVSKVVQQVDELVTKKLLTPTDGEKIKKEAASAKVP